MAKDKKIGNQGPTKGKKSRKKAADEFRHVNHKRMMAAVYLLLRVAVVVVMFFQFFNRNYENVFLCVLTLILFVMPSLIERKLQVDLPDTLEVIILLFIFAAEILGEIRAYYIQFPYWDTMLHTLNGFLCAAIGFSLVDLLNRSERFSLRLSPLFVSVVAFCFSMTVGVFWEFFEHAADQFFLLDMQKDTVLSTISTVTLDETGTNQTVVLRGIADVVVVFADGRQQALGLGGYLDVGLYDTMKDLFVNFIGALVFSTVGYFYVKARGKAGFATRFIPKVPDKAEIAAEIAIRQAEAEEKVVLQAEKEKRREENADALKHGAQQEKDHRDQQ